MALRLGSGGGNKEEHGSRQGAGRDGKKKSSNIFKGEKREKTPPRLAKACKHVYYILLNIAACGLFIALSFIYIEGVYYIYLYILYNAD